jgi:hypothetical protein
LRSISVVECNSLQQLPSLQDCTGLTSIHVQDCKALTSLCSGAVPASLRSLLVNRCQLLTDVPDLSRCVSLTKVEVRYCDALQQLPALPSCIKPSALEETDQQLLLKLVEQRPEFGSVVWAGDKWLQPHDTPGYDSSGDEHDLDTPESDSEEDDSSSSSEGDESFSSGFGSDDSLEYDDSSGSDSGGPPPGGGGGGQVPIQHMDMHPWCTTWFVPGGHLHWSPTGLSHHGGYGQYGWSP